MIKAVQTGDRLQRQELFMPIRVALTGQTHGPDLNATIVLLGHAKVQERRLARLG